MTKAVASNFRTAIANRIEASHDKLASRWLEALTRVVPVAENDIFPGDQPLGQMPAVIRELAAFLRTPAEEVIAANAVVTASATELGHLRHAQHASVHQVVREYRALRAVVAEFIRQESRRLQVKPNVDDLVETMALLETAVDVLLQTTVDAFVAEYSNTIRRHTTRLEGFYRMVSHELRQPLGIMQFAAQLLAKEDTWADRAKRDQILATAQRSVTTMRETLRKLVALSRLEEGTDSAAVQHVEVAAMTQDIVAQLRGMAEARGVDVRMATPLPAVTIDPARLELVLVNLVSNAIKYSDPDKPVRFVEIAQGPNSRHDVCTIDIRDNGIGIAESELRSIFARFYRGRPECDQQMGTSGLGLGLSIVADCVDALKGNIRVESTIGEGTTFSVELPCLPLS